MLQERFDTLRRKCDDAEAEVASLTSRLAASARHRSSSIDALNADADGIDREAADAERRKRAAAAKLQQVEDDVIKEEAKIRDSETRRRAAVSRREAAEVDAAEEERRLKDFENTRAAASAKRDAALREAREVERSSEDAAARLVVLRREQKRVADELAASESSLQCSETELRERRASLQARQSGVAAEVVAAQRAVDDAEHQLAVVARRRDELERGVKAEQATVHSLTVALDDARATVSRLESETRGPQTKIASLEQQLVVLRQSVDGLRREKQDLEHSQDRLQLDIAALKDTCRAQEAELSRRCDGVAVGAVVVPCWCRSPLVGGVSGGMCCEPQCRRDVLCFMSAR